MPQKGPGGSGGGLGGLANRALGAVTNRVASAIGVKRLPVVKVVLVLAGLGPVGLVVLLILTIGAVTGVASLANGQAGALAGGQTNCAPAAGAPAEMQRFMPIYGAASLRFGLGDLGVWYLAAVHRTETNFGDGYAKSYANAIGPMQFLPSTWIKGGQVTDRLVVKPTTEDWRGYATDGDGDGLADTNNVHDAIHAAARMLKNNGAPEDFGRALLAYNPSQEYVNTVTGHADAFRGVCTMSAGSGNVNVGNLNFDDTSGPWAGSMKFAKALSALGEKHGCIPSSEKRPTQNTASGGMSDHFQGNTTAYAVDIAGCSLAVPGGPLDQTAREIAASLGLASHTGVQNVVRGRYRFQLLWQTMVGGNHYDHIHIGVKLVGGAAADPRL